MKGYVQVYTGDGKGKTTAAMGLALRAVGAGLRVFVAQFAKGRDTSEAGPLDSFGDSLVFRHWGLDTFITGTPSPEDTGLADEALAETRRALASGEFDLVIVDEGNVAAALGLIGTKDLLGLIDLKPEHVELVITGRGAAPEIIERADLVTEMNDVRHYYDRGVHARKGIEY